MQYITCIKIGQGPRVGWGFCSQVSTKNAGQHSGAIVSFVISQQVPGFEPSG